MSPRSCCILLFTLQRLVTRVACVCPPRSCSISWHSFSPWHNLSKLCSAHGLPKELFIVVNVVFVVFPSQQAINERARQREVVPIVWRISFSGCRGRVARGEAPGLRPPPVRRAGGSVSGFQRDRGYKQTFCCSLGREACRPAPWVNRPGCRCPRRYPGLRRPWWPS